MQASCHNDNQNMYFRCRKEASENNENLKSRAYAADALGVSESSLAKYELGAIKNVPPEMVVLMADLYRTPELRNWYCKHECPIGQNEPISTSIDGLADITVKILDDLSETNVSRIKDDLTSIARDGRVGESERETFEKIVGLLEDLSTQISELRLYREKSGGDKCSQRKKERSI